MSGRQLRLCWKLAACALSKRGDLMLALGMPCFAENCAKQSYQAIVAKADVSITCEDGLVLMDHTARWRCVPAPDQQPCSPGFERTGKLHAGVGTRCKQVILLAWQAAVLE